MIKNLTKNLNIKLFCLFLAIVLWVYVAAGQSTVGKYPGSINIEAINVSSGLEAVYDVKSVDIRIMADSATWKKLSADSFTARVDMSARSAGTYEVPITVTSSESGVTIVEKTPDKIFVRLEQVISKEVLINKKIEGTAAEGLVAGGVELGVEKTMATGPKSLINNLNEAMVSVKLNGESEDFTKTLNILALDGNGAEISGIHFEPATVQAKVLITKAANNKTVGIKVVTTGSPKTGYFVSSVSANPSVIDIVASDAILNNINYVETAPLDLTNLASDTEKEVSLNLTGGIVLQAGATGKVKVKIKISESDISREIVATITSKNLSGYTISGYGVKSVSVVVVGPKSIIDGLKSSDVVLVLDFNGKTLSSSVNFDLKSSNFILPGSVSISGILPSSLVVTLQRQ